MIQSVKNQNQARNDVFAGANGKNKNESFKKDK